MKKSGLAAVCIALGTSACAVDTNKLDLSAGPLLGAAAGAALGGYVGAQFGGGLGQTLFTAAGAFTGATVGYATGRSLMPGDRSAYNSAVSDALSSEGTTTNATWDNAKTGNGGVIRAGRTYTGVNGTLCRTYRATVAFSDDIVGGDGAACRSADGGWVVVADAFG